MGLLRLCKLFRDGVLTNQGSTSKPALNCQPTLAGFGKKLGSQCLAATPQDLSGRPKVY